MTHGTRVQLIDGRGNLFDGFISDPDPKRCRISVTGFKPDFEKRDYHLHIGISPLKNPERFEWFIEKCVEIGIDEITPLICHNSEKQKIREERLNNIIVSAMKQSLKAKATILNPACSFAAFTGMAEGNNLMIAHCNTAIERKKIREVCSPGGKVVILIGPEGDFDKREIQEAMEKGYQSVHLGQSRLRTETAGVAACCSVYFINQ